MLPPRLASLRVSPLAFHLETTGPFRAPEYKGGLFRGGFGDYFRDLVCVTRAPICTGCPHLQTCAYSTVFETPVDPTRAAVLRKYPNAPHPFTLTPPLEERTCLPPGTAVDLAVTLIGRGIEHLPHFVRVFESMGADGHYGGRFRLRSVSGQGRLVYDGATRRVVSAPPPWPLVNGAGMRKVWLKFITPLRLRTEGRYNSRPNFLDIVQTLLRRIHLLSAIYGGGDGDSRWTHELLRVADGARTLRTAWRMYEWDRVSGRSGRRVPMDGVVGWLEAEGDLSELGVYLKAGEWLGVGNGTSMGLGRYRIKAEA